MNPVEVSELISNLKKRLLSQGDFSPGIAMPHSEATSPYRQLLESIADLRGRPLFYQYISSGRGEGVFVELLDGSVKVDFIGGIGVHILGHSHPKVLAAAKKGALSDVVMQGHLQPGEEYIRLHESLLDVARKGATAFRHVWLAPSGTMANETALKICRQKRKGARHIIAMDRAFAGRSSLMAEVTDNAKYRVGLPRYPEVLRIPFPESTHLDSSYDWEAAGKKALSQMEAYLKEHGDDICAFTFEPIQGEGGFRIGHLDFFLPLLKCCKQAGIPIWVDEVQTFLRTPCPFAVEYFGYQEWVDVATVGKGIQAAATFFRGSFNPAPGLIAGTFAGASAALSASCAILEELTQGDYYGSQGRVAHIQKLFQEKLNYLAQSECKGVLHSVGGVGLMLSFNISEGSLDIMSAFLQKTFKKGLMLFLCGRSPVRVRMLLPAILEERHMDLACKIIAESLHELKAEGVL